MYKRQEFGEVIGTGHDLVHLIGQLPVTRVRGEHGVLMPDGADARAGWTDDVVVTGERLHVVADVGDGLVVVAGVGEHLPAAGLFQRELHRASQPFQHLHHGLRSPWEHHVVDAGGEQGHCDAGKIGDHRHTLFFELDPDRFGLVADQERRCHWNLSTIGQTNNCLLYTSRCV